MIMSSDQNFCQTLLFDIILNYSKHMKKKHLEEKTENSMEKDVKCSQLLYFLTLFH